MANEKPMSAMAFQTKLKEQYKEDGEVNVDERVDTLMQTIQKQNKDNNPFLFSELSNWIETQEITLDELVSPNGSVHQTELGRIIQVSHIEWAKVQEDNRKTEEQQNQKDPFLEELLANESNQAKIDAIDFEKMSFADILEAEKYYDDLTVEQKSIVNQKVYESLKDIDVFNEFHIVLDLVQRGDIKGAHEYIESLEEDKREALKEKIYGSDGSISEEKIMQEHKVIMGLDEEARILSIEFGGKEQVNGRNFKDALKSTKAYRNFSESSFAFSNEDDLDKYASAMLASFEVSKDFTQIVEKPLDGTTANVNFDFTQNGTFDFGFDQAVFSPKEDVVLEYTEATKVVDDRPEKQKISLKGVSDDFDLDKYMDDIFESTPDYSKSLDQTYEEDIGFQEEGIRLTVEETSEVLEAETESVAEIEETTEQRPTDEDIHREEVETAVEEVKEQANELNDYTKEVQDRSLKAFFKNVFDRITRKRIGDGTRKTEGNATQKPAYRKDKRGLVEKISDAYTDWRTGLRTPGEALKSIVTFEDKDLEKPEVNNQPNQLIGNSEPVDPFKKGVDDKVMQNIEVVQQHARQVQKAIAEGKIIPQNVKNAGVKVKSSEEGPGIGGE